MPRSAIASGCVDFVLPPERIARELSRLSRHPYVITPSREERRTSRRLRRRREGWSAAILALLRKTTGADFSALQAGDHQAADRAAHGARPRREAGGLRALPRGPRRTRCRPSIQDCLITVTSFFRDPEAFQVLCEEVLPRLLEGSAARRAHPRVGARLRHRRGGLLDRHLPAGGRGRGQGQPSVPGLRHRPLRERLEKARAGIYPENIAQDVSPERLRRFFTKVDGHYRVSKAIRDLCVFARHDLTKDPPFSRLDLISCRNVLIYLEPRLQQRVLAILHYALRPSGFLLLGASETAGASPELFAPVDRKHRIYSKRPTAVPVVSRFRAPLGSTVESGASAGPEAATPRPTRGAAAGSRPDPPGPVRAGGRDRGREGRHRRVSRPDRSLPGAHRTGARASTSSRWCARDSSSSSARRSRRPGRKTRRSARRTCRCDTDGQLRRLDLEVIPLKGTPEKRALSARALRGASRGAGSGGADPRSAGRAPPRRRQGELRS